MPGEVSNLLGEVADQPQQRLHVDVVAHRDRISSLLIGYNILYFKYNLVS